MSHSCCALRFMQVLCFEIRAGARVTQGAGSHMFCIGPGLIKFASEEGGQERWRVVVFQDVGRLL
jgi:hypothetical protein